MELDFDVFQIQESTGCTSDWLKVYDGKTGVDILVHSSDNNPCFIFFLKLSKTTKITVASIYCSYIV